MPSLGDAHTGGSGGLACQHAARRHLPLADLPEAEKSVYLTARTTACCLFVCSFTFSAVLTALGGGAAIKDFVIGIDLSPTMFLIINQLFIFFLGWPLEWTEIIVILVPIFLPLLDNFGIDPLFFGLLIALYIQTSFLSPLVAMALFYLNGVAPRHVSINGIFTGVVPFIVIVLFAMVPPYVFPSIGMGLPRYLYG
jgi:TRAP-type mannitol/chloroaromatic compound transport system permease large subunit